MNPERWKRIEEIFQAAIDREPSERTAFLAEACEGDDSLRTEVVGLLACHQESSLFDKPPADLAAALLTRRVSYQGTICHYRILKKIGSGGMGEVYSASDSRIGREVALKILPSHFSQDPDRLRRFEQETRAAGMLNHPNIVAIYDSGTHDGSPYLVSELLQGEVLQKKLSDHALPLRKAIDYALQIAKGLSAAHEKGIIHRDLKPGNIFITKEGRVKILDFGLAKLTHPEEAMSPSAASEISDLTDTGVVLGTIVYMSPEQVIGRKVDRRSDIFAFGSVLFEMLSGKRPFGGATQIEIMHAILKTDPPELSTPNAVVPISLERIVRRCLEKDPNDRFQSASDLAFALESMSTTTGTNVAAYKQKKSVSIAWILCGIFFLAALIFGVAFYGLRKAPSDISTSAHRLSIILPENTVLNSLAISPDGQRLAYVTNEMTGFSKLWLHSMDSGHAEEIPESGDATLPFWSPDSRSVAFFTEHSLKKFSIDGGSIETLCEDDIDDPKGGTWNQHGDILFSPRSGAGLNRISARGGEPTSLTQLDDSRGEFRDLFPQFLPDGRHFLYMHRASADYAGVYIGSLDSKERKRILVDPTPVRYIDPGYLLFVRNDQKLMVQQFDKNKFELTGDAVPIANDNSNHWSGPDFSLSGNNILVQGNREGWASRPTWFDRSGKESSPSENYPPVLGEPGSYYFCDISSDDRRLLTIRDGTMWMLDLLKGSFVRFGMADAHDASFSPDGTQVVYLVLGESKVDLYVRPSSGSGKAELLHHWKYPTKNLAWSADNRFIAFAAFARTTKFDAWLLPLTGERKAFPYLQTEAREEGPVFSPNGKWIAYQSNESGQFEVYVRSFPLEAAGRWQISADGGEWPVWRRDGKELFYLTLDKKLMVAEVETGEIFRAGDSKFLFQTRTEPFMNTLGITLFKQYVVSADGSHILVNSLVENTAQTEITVFLNWQNLLKK